MAAVPTFETLLIEIRKSFGLSLTKERSKFVHVKSSEGVHKRLFNELKDDLVKHLGLSENDAFAFESQVKDWSATSLKLNQSLWSGRSSQKQLLWLLATHIYIPSLAKLAAFWQREDIMDKGMPANLFWYLPEEINGELHLPITQVWNWLEDLIFDPSNTLEDQVFGAENEESKSKRLGITRESFKRTLSNWKKTTGKESVKLIEDYFSQDLVISFEGTFKHNENESLNENFERAVKLVKAKGYTSKTLYPELQLENEEVVDQILQCVCSDDLKRRFLGLIATRFSEPSNQTIIRFFSMAQAFQNAYVRFGRIIEGKGFDATNNDPNINRLVQLIAIFKFIYNSTYKVSLDVNPDGRKELFNSEERAFDKEIPDEYRVTLFQAVCGKGRNDGVSNAINDLNSLISELEPSTILDVLDFAENSTSKFQISLDYKSETQKYSKNISSFKVYRNKYSINESIEKIMEEESISLLISIGCEGYFNQSVRQAAFYRLDEMALSPKRRLEQYIAQLAVILNNELKLDRPQNSESLVTGILKKAKSIDGYHAVESDFIHFEAKHELSKGNVCAAEQLFKKALDLPDKMSVGSNRGEIARDLFALRAFNKTNGYSLNNQETLYRDMKYFGGFDIPSSLGLYWVGDDLTASVNSIFPPIQDLESDLIDYYPEMFELYSV
jgi:hypothetical protein